MVPSARQISEALLSLLILSFIFFVVLALIKLLPEEYSTITRVLFLSALGMVAAVQFLICFPRALQHWWQDYRRKTAALESNYLRKVTTVSITLLLLFSVALYVYTIVPLLVVLSPLVLIVFGACVYRALSPQVRLVTPKNLAKAVGPRPARVIWLIIDELDQRLGIESRPEGTELPNLDKLLETSFHASNAAPPCHCTEISIPALLTGKMVLETRVTANECMLRLDSQSANTPLSSSDHLFRKLRKKNLNCAAIGWYHPYGRLFGESLSFCRWYDDENLEDQTPRRGLRYIEGVLRGVFESPRYSLFGTSVKTKRWRNVWGYLLRDTLEIARDQDIHLGFLHWNIPHAPFINNSNLRNGGSRKRKVEGYFGNLELMDEGLGALMEEISPLDNVTLIVSADHWWREAGGYDGKIDKRVPFIIKLANQQKEYCYKEKFNTVLTSDLVEDILEGNISNVDELNSWMISNGEDIPPSKGWD